MQVMSNDPEGSSSKFGCLPALVVMGAAALGIVKCSSDQAEKKESEVAPLVSARIDYLTEQTGRLRGPAETFLARAGTARDIRDQALLNQVEKCSTALILMRDLLEHRVDPSLEVDYALTPVQVQSLQYNTFPLSMDLPRGGEYLDHINKCTDACIATFEETAHSIEESTASHVETRSALFSSAHGSLMLLVRHARDHSLSFDKQFVVLNKFGDKRMIAVSDPFYQAESAVNLLRASLR